MAYPTPGQISSIKKIARVLGITIGDSTSEDYCIWQAIEKLMTLQRDTSKQLNDIQTSCKRLQGELSSIRATVDRLGTVQTSTKGRFA